MSLVCVIGIPGSGKTTLCQGLVKLLEQFSVTAEVFSYDRMPQNEECHTHRKNCEQLVLNYVLENLSMIRTNRQIILIDDIMYLRSMRRVFLRFARRYGLAFCTVLVDTPYAEAVRRNKERSIEFRVSNTDMENIRSKIEVPEDAIRYKDDMVQLATAITNLPLPDPTYTETVEDHEAIDPLKQEFDKLSRNAVRVLLHENPAFDGRIISMSTSTGNQLGDDFFDIPLVPQYKELNVDNDDAESEQFFRETNGARVPRLEKENLTPLALAGAMRELKIEPAEAGATQPFASSAVEDYSTSVAQAAVDPLTTEEITESIPKLAMFGYQKKPQRRSYEQRKQEMEAEKEKEVQKAAPRVPSRSRYAVTREDAPVLRPRHRSTSLADRQRQQSVERAPATQTRGRSPGPAVRPLPASSGPNSDRQRSVSRNSQERMAQTSYRARAGSVERATGPSVPSVRPQNAIRSRTPSVSASTRAPLTGSRPQSPAGRTLGSRPQSQEPRPVRAPSPSLGAQPTQITRHRSPSVGNRPASPAMGTRSLSSSQANATQGPTRVSGVRVPAAKPPVRTATSRGTVSAANGIATTGAVGAGASLRNKTRTTGPLRAPPRQAEPVAKPGLIRVPSKDNNLRATPRAPTSAARRAAAPTSAARRAAAPTSAARSAANTPRARHFGGSEVRRPVVPRSSVIHGVTPQKTDVFKVGLRRYPVASGTTPMRPLSDPNDGIEPSNAEHRIAMRRERSDATIGEERPNSQASGTSDGGRSRARAAGGATPKPNVADVVNRLYQPRRPTGATPARSTVRPVAAGRTPTVTLPSSRRVMQTPKGMFGALKQKVNIKPRAPEASATSEARSQAEAQSSTVSSNVEVPDCQ